MILKWHEENVFEKLEWLFGNKINPNKAEKVRRNYIVGGGGQKKKYSK